MAGTIASVVVSSRSEAIQRYEQWLLGKIGNDDPEVIRALQALKEDSVLVCWCKPAACHGDVIMEVWKAMKEAGEL
jgi:hypothetical protein